MKKYLFLFLIPFLVLFPSFRSSADSGSIGSLYGFSVSDRPVMNSNGYANSSIYVPGILNTGFASYDSTHFVDYFDTIQFPSSYNASDFPYFVFCFNNSGDSIYFYAFDESIDVVRSTNGYLFSVNDDDQHQVLSVLYSYSNNSWSFDPSSGVNIINIGGVGDVQDVISLVGYGFWFFSNTHLYAMTSGYDPNTYSLLSTWRTNPELFTDVNYSLYDSNGNLDYNNPLLGGSGESAANNLYMNNPKWQFNNIPSFGSLLDTNSKGNAVFSGQLTDYQKQNLNNFKLQFSFNTFWSGYTVRIGSDDVTPITTNFSKTFLYETEISLSDFYNSGGICSFYIDDIFENSVSNDVDQTVNDFADFYIHEYGSGTSNFRTSFNVKLVALDNSGDSGICTAYYSYKTGTGQTTNNSMGINSNPYVDNDGNSSGVTDPFDNPSGNNNGVGNVGDGSIVNNNNPVININNNNQFEDGDSDGLLTKILLLLANNQTASSEGLAEVADTSGYVQVLGATFTAVPTNWWTVLTAAFIASIGIIVISFVLKVILNFVT